MAEIHTPDEHIALHGSRRDGRRDARARRCRARDPVPLSLRRGTVTAIVERLDRLDRIEVDGAACISYPRRPVVELGDGVLVNVQAGELGLGSGGFDVLYANLTRGLELQPEPRAHVVELPYTPLQAAARHAEEDLEPAETLGDMPVVCTRCTASSRPSPPAWGRGCAWPTCSFPAGALPVSLSDAVRALKERGLLEVRFAAGACVDGDLHCVGVASAPLGWAAAAEFDAAVCAIGPGIIGAAFGSARRPRRRRGRERRRRARGLAGARRASRAPTSGGAAAASRTARGPPTSFASVASPWPGRPG